MRKLALCGAGIVTRCELCWADGDSWCASWFVRAHAGWHRARPAPRRLCTTLRAVWAACKLHLPAQERSNVLVSVIGREEQRWTCPLRWSHGNCVATVRRPRSTMREPAFRARCSPRLVPDAKWRRPQKVDRGCNGSQRVKCMLRWLLPKRAAAVMRRLSSLGSSRRSGGAAVTATC